jgi:hypothetical protein
MSPADSSTPFPACRTHARKFGTPARLPDTNHPLKAPDAMLTQIVSAIALTFVVAGVALQLAAVSRLGLRIVRDKVRRRVRRSVRRAVPAGVTKRSAPAPIRSTTRRRSRDYRQALRSARHSAEQSIALGSTLGHE